ncbi:enoyl-CoA hydratase/isomerase family protein [Desulfosarcina sp. OttesenSCG-928-A07]|nr:enoyl-CoA hydratase/isomerase family protein [Desulfosarcina sp. OttesenSCG-928-G17]MDL2329253.1 enoyl-CoA hydratase/isomerase family protein [Desulfosarcina sp. OttesenSCG-928-A07]
MNLGNIKIEENNHIATLTIDHPPANAWDWQTMSDFEKALDDVEKNPDIFVVVLTGAGEKCFSAGFDVRDAAANGDKTSALGRILWRRLDRFEKPVIAVINGFALGGGLELAMSCHFRIMADAPAVTIGLTELNLGIIPGWGGTQRLSRLVGKAKALNMILFSERIDAKTALEIGLVDKIAPPDRLMAEALEFAKMLSERPPIAVRYVLKAFSAGVYEGVDAGLAVEDEGSAFLRTTEDRKEGFAAFLEKRKPNFTGR